MVSVWTYNGLNQVNKIITKYDTSKYVEKFIIGTGTNTPTQGDVGLDGKITSFTAKAFDSGYPAFNTTNRTTTIRGTISSTEANGYNISESALVDSGDTMIFTHDVFNPITKNLSTEIIIQWTITSE